MTNWPGKFAAKVRKTDGCWIWIGWKRDGEYGGAFHGGKRWLAHRLAWALAKGPIPKGLQVLHRCDQPACVRPSHLFLGTQRDNIEDMMAKGRHRGAPQPGESNPQAKLNWIKVRQIRLGRAKGERILALAQRFRVSEAAIAMICKNRRWIE